LLCEERVLFVSEKALLLLFYYSEERDYVMEMGGPGEAGGAKPVVES